MNETIQYRFFALEKQQALFALHGFFSIKNQQVFNEDEQLDETEDKEAAVFALRRLRFVLENIDKFGLSKEQKKYLELKTQKKINELLELLKKPQPKKTLEKLLDGLVKFGEELGELLMAILTGTHDKIFSPEEKLLFKKEFDRFQTLIQIQSAHQFTLRTTVKQHPMFFKPPTLLPTQQKQLLEKLELELMQKLRQIYSLVNKPVIMPVLKK